MDGYPVLPGIVPDDLYKTLPFLGPLLYSQAL